jgi:hypothetical protein
LHAIRVITKQSSIQGVMEVHVINSITNRTLQINIFYILIFSKSNTYFFYIFLTINLTLRSWDNQSSIETKAWVKMFLCGKNFTVFWRENDRYSNTNSFYCLSFEYFNRVILFSCFVINGCIKNTWAGMNFTVQIIFNFNSVLKNWLMNKKMFILTSLIRG